MLALVLGFPLVFVMAWFLLRVVVGRWADDPEGDAPIAGWQPGLDPEAPGRERVGSGASDTTPRDGGLDRPEGTG